MTNECGRPTLRTYTVMAYIVTAPIVMVDVVMAYVVASSTPGHNYIGHSYIGHNDTGHNYIGHNYIVMAYVVASSTPGRCCALSAACIADILTPSRGPLIGPFATIGAGRRAATLAAFLEVMSKCVGLNQQAKTKRAVLPPGLC